MTYDPQMAKGIVQIAETGQAASGADSAIGMLMNLRKTANHPLLIRDQYDDQKLGVIARYSNIIPSYCFEK